MSQTFHEEGGATITVEDFSLSAVYAPPGAVLHGTVQFSIAGVGGSIRGTILFNQGGTSELQLLCSSG